MISIDFVHKIEFIASQADLADDVVREYIAIGFTDNIHTCASLSDARTRAQFMALLELYDKQGLSTQHSGTNHKDSQGRYSTKICYECDKQKHISRFCDKDKSAGQGACQPQLQEVRKGRVLRILVLNLFLQITFSPTRFCYTLSVNIKEENRK